MAICPTISPLSSLAFECLAIKLDLMVAEIKLTVVVHDFSVADSTVHLHV